MNDVERATLTITNLENIRKHLTQKAAELNDERGRVALGAHTGDAKMRKRLDQINAETATFGSEMRSVESAITEANARLGAAQQAEALRVDREKAKQIAVLN